MVELYEVTIPASGSVENVVVTQWLVQVGDTVTEDDLLAEISTDKVDTELASPRAGRVAALLVAEEDEVGIGDVVALLADADATDDDIAAALADRNG